MNLEDEGFPVCNVSKQARWLSLRNRKMRKSVVTVLVAQRTHLALGALCRGGDGPVRVMSFEAKGYPTLPIQHGLGSFSFTGNKPGS